MQNKNENEIEKLRAEKKQIEERYAILERENMLLKSTIEELKKKQLLLYTLLVSGQIISNAKYTIRTKRPALTRMLKQKLAFHRSLINEVTEKRNNECHPSYFDRLPANKQEILKFLATAPLNEIANVEPGVLKNVLTSIVTSLDEIYENNENLLTIQHKNL